MKKINITQNPFIIFTPFLIIYWLIIIIFHQNTLEGDQAKYLEYARNLTQGFYSLPGPDIDIITGPGYSIFLMPFVWFDLPLLSITLMNGIFKYLSLVFLFKTLHEFVTFKNALIFSLFWACYYNCLEYIHKITSETFSVFLMTILAFFIVRTFRKIYFQKNIVYLILAGLTLGFLALTKIIFGYVIIFMLIIIAILSILNLKNKNYWRGFLIVTIALMTTIPYLINTYQLSGKIFYWGTSGGNNLYWMSTPFEGEYGDWFRDPVLDAIAYHSDNQVYSDIHVQSDNPWLHLTSRRLPNSVENIKENHGEKFEEFNKFKGVERDNAFKKAAINNIKTHPYKFIQNCISNTGRILFNFPYSYSIQKSSTLYRLPFNGIIVVFMIISLIPTILFWRKISFSIKFMLSIVILYLGGSILGSAETRMFTLIVPVLLIWIAYIVHRTIIVKLNFDYNGS